VTEPPLDRDRIASLLEASAATILAEVEALGLEARWRPAPGEWPANECVGHLIEAERRGFAGRIRMILAGDRPRLDGWDPDEVASARRDDARDPDELLAEFLSIRAESLDLVPSIREDDLARIGIHPEVGELTVGDLLGEWVHHDRNHAKQLLSVVQARVWGQMRNARRFSDPNA
jgi:DinB superfamily